MSEWNAVATQWRELWGGFAEPVQRAAIETAGIGEATRVLDVGCGSGEFLALVSEAGGIPTGVDPAEAMVALALQHGTAIVGHAEQLPFEPESFDVVTAFNAFQFADDPINALAEFARVLVPGGRIVIANWADAKHNDVDAIERVLADDDSDDPESKLRLEGGLQQLLETFGLEVIGGGLVDAPWHAADDDILVRGVLLGEDADTQQRLADTVREAGAPFLSPAGGYVLRNAFRYAVAVV